MFETKVYKECYPFCREVLYESQKRDLFVKLLYRRELDLMRVYKQQKKSPPVYAEKSGRRKKPD